MTRQWVPRLRVTTGIVSDGQSRILLALRNGKRSNAFLWELPGGKTEQGEDSYEALCRELHEELLIEVRHAKRVGRIYQHYHHGRVLVDAWQITDFGGWPSGNEGQLIAWFTPAEALVLPLVPSVRRLLLSMF